MPAGFIFSHIQTLSITTKKLLKHYSNFYALNLITTLKKLFY